MSARPLAAALFAFALAPGSAAGEAFVSCFEDLPLMEGLSEHADACTNFDTPGGRLAQGEAAGPVREEEVLVFYREVLPALGWAVGDGAPVVAFREGERLVVAVEGREGGGVLVHYALAPAARSR